MFSSLLMQFGINKGGLRCGYILTICIIQLYFFSDFGLIFATFDG